MTLGHQFAGGFFVWLTANRYGYTGLRYLI
jgi:hypothetical protein